LRLQELHEDGEQVGVLLVVRSELRHNLASQDHCALAKAILHINVHFEFLGTIHGVQREVAQVYQTSDFKLTEEVVYRLFLRTFFNDWAKAFASNRVGSGFWSMLVTVAPILVRVVLDGERLQRVSLPTSGHFAIAGAGVFLEFDVGVHDQVLPLVNLVLNVFD